jgi:ribose 5-phosphate isomerase
MSEHLPRIVIVGGGFGGLAAAKALRRTPADVILIDRTNHHLFPTIRSLNTGSEFITEEGNLILDCECGEIHNPDVLAASIRNIVGVVEHGLFLHLAERALVSDG